MNKHTLDIESVTHRYGSFVAVDDVDISIDGGEILALLGPSGCGKTTLLRIVAGFVRQTQGRVRVDGRAIDDLQPNRRDIGIVFQNYALFPHMTVAQNVGYGLVARGRSRAQVAQRVGQCLEIVQLPHLAGRYPRQLSGGQQQRVALARAIATEPRILLLDEPFSALDKNLRLDMQIEIKRLQRQLGLTAILVTHDQEEAMSVADRIAVMHRGRVEQLGTPVEVYDRPRTLFVNSFIGTTNLLAGLVAGREAAGLRVDLDAGASIVVPHEQALPAGQRVTVSLRPEHLALAAEQGAGRWPVQVGLSLPLGPTVVHQVTTRDRQALKVIAARHGAVRVPAGQAWCGLRPEARPCLFPATTPAN
ncbi:ABC transporter ATP-binding protein [Orrella sp. JC864]|uniref:ABC transporter ATP-binding protein n=1 Tax=Orrella sp. JC864 TaxID=3120298 RepID=UPI00300A6DDF